MLSTTGVQSEYHSAVHPVLAIHIILFRCDARPENLDNPTGKSHRRSHAKTDFLINQWDPGILWDQFGIRSDIVVYLYFESFSCGAP